MTTLKDDTETTETTETAEIDDSIEVADSVEMDDAATEKTDEKPTAKAKRRWSGVFGYAVLPAIALLLALAAGYFTWANDSAGDLAAARTDSVRVASEDVTALLSYQPDSADKQLNAARDRLTGEFKDAYTSLIREVVIPGAKEKHISAVAKVSAAGSVSATANHAVVLLYANQTVTIGDGAPTDSQPVIRVTLDKIDGRWLVSRFDPV